MKKARLYFDTVRYLKFKQIAYRLFYKVYKPRTTAEGCYFSIKQQPAKIIPPFLLKSVEIFKEDKATFLQHTAIITQKNIWNDKQQEKLWLYNLHYFDGLCADTERQSQQAYRLLERWVVENDSYSGNGWEPYPLSLRIVNIIKYALLGNELSDEVKSSLFLQSRHLNKLCEYHILGNHLFENYKALCFAGLYFDCSEAKKWFRKGICGLKHEVAEQVLSDGGHFELSPMYHSIILEGLLDLDNLFRRYALESDFPWHNVVQKMLGWLNAMKRPNNEISYFNDAANGIAHTPDDLFNYAKLLGYLLPDAFNQLHSLKGSGYYVYKNSRIKAILDIAQVGPDYLPGHAHADTLCFELYIDDTPFLVNLGTSCYGLSKRRQFERSTKAHNTVVINNQDSSEIWGGFRVARRARPSLTDCLQDKSNVIIQASHTGYRRLNNKLTHQRQWCFKENSIEIKDEIAPYFDEGYAIYHFHPSFKLIEFNEESLVLSSPDNKTIVVEYDNAADIVDNEYAQSFGDVRPCLSLKVELSKVTGTCCTKIQW